MNEALGSRGTARAASPGRNAASNKLPNPEEQSSSSMYGQKWFLEDEEEMKEKFIAVGVCAMDAKVGRELWH